MDGFDQDNDQKIGISEFESYFGLKEKIDQCLLTKDEWAYLRSIFNHVDSSVQTNGDDSLEELIISLQSSRKEEVNNVYNGTYFSSACKPKKRTSNFEYNSTKYDDDREPIHIEPGKI